MVFRLVFEAILTNIVPMRSTRLSKVVRHFKHFASGFCVECVHGEQVRGSIHVNFVIKATFPKLQCYLYAINGLNPCTMLQSSEQSHCPMCLHSILECRRD